MDIKDLRDDFDLDHMFLKVYFFPGGKYSLWNAEFATGISIICWGTTILSPPENPPVDWNDVDTDWNEPRLGALGALGALADADDELISLVCVDSKSLALASRPCDSDGYDDCDPLNDGCDPPNDGCDPPNDCCDAPNDGCDGCEPKSLVSCDRKDCPPLANELAPPDDAPILFAKLSGE